MKPPMAMNNEMRLYSQASNINDWLKSMYSETSIEAGPQLSGHPLLSGRKSRVPKIMSFIFLFNKPLFSGHLLRKSYLANFCC